MKESDNVAKNMLILRLGMDQIGAFIFVQGSVIYLMTDTEFEDCRPRYLSGVRVAHKTGAWENSVSDVGIVFLEGKPFVICVYSDDNADPDDAQPAIGAIAFDAFNYETARQ